MDSYNYSLIVACHNYITRIVRSMWVTKKKIFWIGSFVWIFADHLA